MKKTASRPPCRASKEVCNKSDEKHREYRYTVSGSSGRSAVIFCAALNGLVKGPAAL